MESWQQLRKVADRRRSRGDREGEFRALDRAARSGPTWLRLRIAQLCVELNRPEVAVRHLRAVAGKDPQAPAALKPVIKQLALNGDAANEIVALRLQLELVGDHPSARGRLAELLAGQGRFAEAVAVLQAVAEPSSRDLQSWRRLHQAAVAAGPDAEIGVIQELIKAGAATEDAPDRLARLLVAAGRGQEVVALARAAAKTEPADGSAWQRWSSPFVEAGDTETELQVLRLFLKNKTSDPALHARLYWLQSRKGDETEALRHLRPLRPLGERELWRRLLAPAEGPAPGRLQGRTIVFLHMQKTGGTTVERGLKQMLSSSGLNRIPGKAAKHNEVEELGDPSDQADAVSGSFTYAMAQRSVIPRLAGKPIYMSVVRDPVERLRSLYSYVCLRRSTHQERSKELKVEYDEDFNVVLERWLDNERVRRAMQNYQCASLGRRRTAASAIHAIETEYLTVVSTRKITPLLGVLGDALLVRWQQDRQARGSNSSRLTIDQGLADRFRQDSEDQKLFEWVLANEDRLLERARAALYAMARPAIELGPPRPMVRKGVERPDKAA